MSEKIYWDTRDFVRGELKKILKKRRECDTLARMEIFGSPTFVLFVVLFAGLAFGNLSIKGISFGSSGVLFAALVAGHFGLHVPDGIADVGTAIFVYCVGLGVGNRFFDSLKSRGKYLIILSLLVVSVAWLAAWVLGSMLGMDAGTVAGLFAGACTSTPALAAAIESQGSQASAVNIGYAVAYPFGVVGVVLFVQLLPRFLRQNLDDNSGKSFEVEDKHTIISRVVQVTNPELIGRPIGSFCAEKNLHCRITRIARDGALMPLQRDDSFTENGEVLLVGERDDLEREIPCFGHVRSTKGRPRIYTDERAELIVLSRAICNKSLRELDTLGQYGIVISRITRLGLTFIPTADTEVQRNDVLRVVGSPEAIESFRRECGHRSTALNAADILSLVGGLMLGVLLGKMQFSFGGSSYSRTFRKAWAFCRLYSTPYARTAHGTRFGAFLGRSRGKRRSCAGRNFARQRSLHVFGGVRRHACSHGCFLRRGTFCAAHEPFRNTGRHLWKHDIYSGSRSHHRKNGLSRTGHRLFNSLSGCAYSYDCAREIAL